MKLSFIRVQRWDEALDLLAVRNECREGMTHTTGVITEEEQAKFFTNEIVPGHTFECYLLRDGHALAGYGLLKRDGDRKWMSAGLTRPYRGRHLSRLLINLITEIAYADRGTEVWIDVLDSNLALIGDLRCGYQLVETRIREDGKMLRIMRHQRERVLGFIENSLLTRMKSAKFADIVSEMIEVDAISRDW